MVASAALVWAQTNSSSRVSLPSARLTITPKAKPSSRLVVDMSLFDLGSIDVGNALRHTFTINNDGTDFVIGSADCKGPCTVVAGSPYALKPGEVGNVTVEFTPKTEGAFSGLVTFSGEYGALSIVSGTATAAAIVNAIPQAVSASRPLAPEIIALGEGTSFQVRWRGEAGKEYQVWYSEDLVHWTAAGDPVAANTGMTTFLDDGSATTPPPVAAKVRFYRVGDSNASIVGFRRVQLPSGDTPVSVPFMGNVVAQGTISSLAAKTVTDASAAYHPNQFRVDTAGQPQPHLLTVTSGDNAGHWFVIAQNDVHSITIDDLEGTYDLTTLLHVGDSYIVHPLYRIADVFGTPNDTALRRGDQVFLWDVVAQTYEPPVALNALAPDAPVDWIQDGKPVGNLALFPAEGMLVRRSGPGTAEIVLTGTVPSMPVLQDIQPGNNLVGLGQPLPVLLNQSDLLASGFAGSHVSGGSDKLFLYNPKRQEFKTMLWNNSLLGRWMSPISDLRPSQLELTPASAFFIQRNQVRGFEWVQKPPSGK